MAFRCSLFVSLTVLAFGDLTTDDWKQSLSALERAALENGIAKLQKKSRKEQDTASEDGPDAQEFFKEEYERKISNLLKQYKKVAEKSAADETTESHPASSDASIDTDSDSDPSADAVAQSTDDSSVDLSDDSGAESSAVDEATESEPLMLVAESNADGNDASGDWKASLSAQQRERLQNGIVKLQKKSEKEQDIASQDGPKAQAFFKREYEAKTAHLLKEYERLAAKSAAEEETTESQATDSGADSTADASSESSADSGVDLSAELQGTDPSVPDGAIASDPLMLLAESNTDGDEVVADAREADKEARRTARNADEEARKAARKADEEARRAARMADEEARKAARRADESKRHEERLGNPINIGSSADEAEPVMLPALGQHAITFLVSFVAGASLVAIATHASIQLRWCRNRAQVALLDAAAQV